MERDLETFLLRDLAVGRGIDSIGRDDDILALGIVDSLGLLQLVSFLEEKFGIKVEDEDLVIDNFRSISRIEQFVEEKQREKAA